VRDGVQPYENAHAPIGDFMKRLDLWIGREVARHGKSSRESESWAGFVAITDSEVDRLLAGAGAVESEKVPELQDLQRQLADLDADIDRRIAAGIEAGVVLPIVALAAIFRLHEAEIKALIACLGPEIDRRYERLYGYLQDDMTRKRPSLGLLLSFCSQAPGDELRLRTLFAPHAPLLRYRLLHIVDDDQTPFMSRQIRIDNRVVSFLLGEACFDPGIQGAVERIVPDGITADPGIAHAPAAEQLVNAITGCFGKQGLEKKPLFYLQGRLRAGKETLVREICRRLRFPLLVVDAAQIASGPAGLDEGLFLSFRESLLCESVLHIKHIDRVMEQNRDRLTVELLFRTVRDMGGITFLSGEKPWPWPAAREGILFLSVELRTPDYNDQAELWRKALEGRSGLADADYFRIISKYPLSAGQIEDAALSAKTYAALRGPDEPVTVSDVDAGCKAHSRPDLGHLARKLKPKHGWGDIILPQPQLAQLREICDHVHYRSVVYGQWGFGRKLSLGKGLNALFFGPPGTGKTMAAEVLARELRLDLYKIDLSQVVSKYIGETEKNLHQIFREAQACHAILFFDEADALLGKRSDVKDAHDRYANLEISYLLQKMEEYEGITILATNLRQNMDEAFTRRLRFIVEFPFPEEEYRLRIWKGIWPEETPLAEDVSLDFFAKKFKLSGGNIRNIAVSAAFSASSSGQPVDMKHLLNATKQEFLKMGRLVDESEYA
jgi:hypothetical protein